MALDCAEFDEIAIELRVFALEGTGTALDLVLETGMQLDTDHGWVTMVTFPGVSSAPAIHLRNLRGLLRYLRWRVTALTGTGMTAATFLIDGVAHAWTSAVHEFGKHRRKVEHTASSPTVLTPQLSELVVLGAPAMIALDDETGAYSFWYNNYFLEWKAGCTGFANPSNRWTQEMEWNPPCTHQASSYPNIQAALDAIPAGSVLCIPPGSYYENLEIKKDVVLRGQYPGDVHLFHSSLQALVQDRPLIKVNPGVKVRLMNLTLHYGRIAGPQLPSNWSWLTPLLELQWVNIFGAGDGGGITGRFHVRARLLTIDGSNGHGIDIVGSADIANSKIRSCKGWGAIIDNSSPTPAWSWVNKWRQQFCIEECFWNGQGGLLLRNRGGEPFRVSGRFENNVGFGVRLQDTTETILGGVHAANTHKDANGLGVGIYIESSNSVSLTESLIATNAQGLWLVACGEPQTVVFVNKTHFSHNIQFDMAKSELEDSPFFVFHGAACGPTTPAELVQGPFVTCHPHECKLLPVTIEPPGQP